ncbi:MAG: metallophosphoesterase, partial [Sulfurovaceae bacterium]|nr:metallophosphoesterase [Sulfurovaceae bacterium]
QTLLALVEKLPQDAKLVFVGDLVDKGLQSKEVIAFIRKHNYLSVKGNHESSVIEAGRLIIAYLNNEGSYADIMEKWTKNRLGTFLSYGMVEQMSDGNLRFINDEKAIEKFLYDSVWMESLPYYLELDAKHLSGKQVVVSHSNISNVWEIRHDTSQRELFEYTTQWTRTFATSDEVDIFNIYGHSPRKYGAEIKSNYANIDTGCCYYSREEYGYLTAYCVESGEVIEVKHVNV